MKERRELLNITLREIAENIGVKEATVQRYESGNGIKSVPHDAIVGIAETLKCTPAYLMGWEDNLTPETASLHVEMLTDSELLKCMEDLVRMPEDKRKRVYGYVDSLKER